MFKRIVPKVEETILPPYEEKIKINNLENLFPKYENNEYINNLYKNTCDELKKELIKACENLNNVFIRKNCIMIYFGVYDKKHADYIEKILYEIFIEKGIDKNNLKIIIDKNNCNNLITNVRIENKYLHGYLFDISQEKSENSQNEIYSL